MRKALFAAAILIPMHAAADGAVFSKGEAVYEEHCASCHTYGPPPSSAPPIVGISGHYRDAFATEEEAVARMVDFMRAPSAKRSVLLPMAVHAWGLMPPMPQLSEEELELVSRWVWRVYEVEGGVRPRPPGGGR